MLSLFWANAVYMCVCAEERVSLSCVDHLMTVCIHRDAANLSAVRSRLDADCSSEAVGAVLKRATSDGGFCYVVDMSQCSSNISTNNNNNNNNSAVCISASIIISALG